MFRFAWLISPLLVGVALSLGVGQHGSAAAMPVVLAVCVVSAVLVNSMSRGSVLEAGVAASMRLVSAFSRVLAPAQTGLGLPSWTGVPRRCVDEQSRRGAFRRQDRPDTPGKALARAPGQV